MLNRMETISSDKNGFLSISRWFEKTLPGNRRFTELEAAYLVQIDLIDKNKVSIGQYAKRWKWSKSRAKKFLTLSGLEIACQENGYGFLKPIDFHFSPSIQPISLIDRRREKNKDYGDNIFHLLEKLVAAYIDQSNEANYPQMVAGYEDPVHILTHADIEDLMMFKSLTQSVDDYVFCTVDFLATSSKIIEAFKAVGCGSMAMNASIFSAKVRKSRELLLKCGWETISTSGIEPYFKISGGYRFYKFRKTFTH